MSPFFFYNNVLLPTKSLFTPDFFITFIPTLLRNFFIHSKNLVSIFIHSNFNRFDSEILHSLIQNINICLEIFFCTCSSRVSISIYIKYEELIYKDLSSL